jgi:hypothetical protein
MPADGTSPYHHWPAGASVQEPCAPPVPAAVMGHPVSVSAPGPPDGPSLEQTVRAWYDAGHSQRAIARELNLDRRKVKRIIDQAA